MIVRDSEGMGRQEAPYELKRELAEEMGSITAARRLARLLLVECGYDGHHEDVLLVVSELVTNALVHGAGRPVLRLAGGRSSVRIEVSDASTKLPEPRRPGPADGWGLHVVEQLCTGWGADEHAFGKVVWCELAAHFTPVVVHQHSSGL
jgi:anti-sigma regulatory factor (Ser/Thr protein kinase)